jgi:hypothetical protein
VFFRWRITRITTYEPSICQLALYIREVSALLNNILYRKNESYATETGEIVRRQTKMHKWGIPLSWVIGVGVSAPAGALASMWAGTCAAWHEYGQGRSFAPFIFKHFSIVLNFLSIFLTK